EHGIGGQRDVLEIPGAQGQVGRADAGGLDLDPDLSLARLGQRDLGPLQHLRRSVSGHHNRVRHSSSFLAAAWGWPRTGTSAVWPLPAMTAPVPASPGRGRAFVTSRLPMPVVSRADPGGPVIGSLPVYVICHVIVNVTYHVIVEAEGGRRAGPPELAPRSPTRGPARASS